MSNGKFALATAEQKAEINEVVTKKVFGKQKPRKALQNDLDPSRPCDPDDGVQRGFYDYPGHYHRHHVGNRRGV